mmetsp:Transcript_14332/g.21083  ORF Transcript_14332/g.21083 Transcript_14332/m.21083 type:complete len:278 (-) Transcript_14332:122-955(-)
MTLLDLHDGVVHVVLPAPLVPEPGAVLARGLVPHHLLPGLRLADALLAGKLLPPGLLLELWQPLLSRQPHGPWGGEVQDAGELGDGPDLRALGGEVEEPVYEVLRVLSGQVQQVLFRPLAQFVQLHRVCIRAAQIVKIKVHIFPARSCKFTRLSKNVGGQGGSLNYLLLTLVIFLFVARFIVIFLSATRVLIPSLFGMVAVAFVIFVSVILFVVIIFILLLFIAIWFIFTLFIILFIFTSICIQFFVLYLQVFLMFIFFQLSPCLLLTAFSSHSKVT